MTVGTFERLSSATPFAVATLPGEVGPDQAEDVGQVFSVERFVAAAKGVGVRFHQRAGGSTGRPASCQAWKPR